MRKTQNKRTVHDILYYVKMKNRQGYLQESMNDIAKGTGYSNATVHRALQTLADDGWIKIIPSKNQSHPHTIHYLGPDNDDIGRLLHDAQAKFDHIDKATEELKDIFFQLRSQAALAEHQAIESFNHQEYETH